MKYRPDIDGLRAVSVALVVLFHAGAPVSGGFIGVDVFFVISGYLITSLIQRDIDADRFSMVSFWERRVRRILPASIFCLLGTLAFGSLLMLPHDFAKLAESALAQSLTLSNVYFWRDAGYFSGASETKPLLNTWSLSVEEQFYLLYPLFLVTLGKSRHVSVRQGIVAVIAVSFGISIWGVAYRPSACFFLLPTRAWELLVGGLLVTLPAVSLGVRLRECAAFAGIILVVVPGFAFDSSTPFPGFAALLPCAGAALVIVANSDPLHSTFVGRFLSHRAIVFLGVISYSLYLWHWPIMAFARYMLIEFDLYVGVCTVLLSLAAAVLSWKFIEQPFRKSRAARHSSSAEKASSWRPILIGLTATLFVMSVSAAIVLDGGAERRFDDSTRMMAIDASWTGAEMQAGRGQAVFPRIGISDRTRDDFFVLGDSHALMMSDVLDQAAKHVGVGGQFISIPGVPPLPSVWRRSSDGPNPEVRRAVEYLIDSDCKNVILVARWSGYIEGYSEGDLRFEERGQEIEDLIIGDRDTVNFCPKDGQRVLRTHLAQLVKELSVEGIQTWIVEQVPEQRGPTALPLFLRHRLGLEREFDGVSLEEHLNRQSGTKTVISSMRKIGAKLVDVQDSCFDLHGQSILIADGRACYRDNDHLTKFGAKLLLLERFESMFKKIKMNN